MILKYTVGTAVLLAAIWLALRWRPEPDTEKESADLAARVLEGVQAQDYEAFVALGGKGVRTMHAGDFRSLVERHAPRLRRGHELRARTALAGSRAHDPVETDSPGRGPRCGAHARDQGRPRGDVHDFLRVGGTRVPAREP